VLGERRIGKSSLLNQIYQALAANPGLVSVHATAQNWNHDSQQQFYTRLHACLACALGLKNEKPVEDYPGLRDF
jgi:ABC-type transporter Mla maintaining outer membrane lipid asymmetry ATPase subunit MlaF